MSVDIEKTLARELREVADRLQVPPMPRLPEEPPRPARRRGPLLVAAAVVLIAAGTAGVVATLPDQDTRPAQPSPSPVPSPAPSPTESAGPIPRTAPSLAHVVDEKLYVDGAQVPGSWWSVQPAGDAWIAVQGMPPTWWWGRGAEQHELPNGEDVTPKISPDGRYVAVVRVEGRRGMLTVVDTRSGENLPGTPTHFGSVRPEEGAYVTAVTDEGQVVIRQGNSYTVWSEDLLVSTLSGQMVFDATSAGVVAGDVDGGPTYLAQISPKGDLVKTGDLPEHDDLTVSPGGTWLAWTPIGTTGGETTSVPSLEIGTLDGSRSATLDAPDGWAFKVRTYTWEDDEHLVSTVESTDGGAERMARCTPSPARCVLTKAD